VRQAFNYAINKQAVVQVALNGLGVPIYGVLSPTMIGYWPGIKNYTYPYNPQKALALLAQAGYVKKNGVLQKNGKPLSFTAVTFSFEPFQQTAVVVQAQLKQIGVTMNIQQQDLASAIATEQHGKSAADFEEYIYPLPDIFYIWFHSSQIGVGFADSHYRDPALDALIVKMRTTSDSAARAAILVQLEKYISDKALWVPLWDPYSFTALQPRVKGAFLDARGRLVLNNATVS
jgi:peptide/nickel transport system substrate-binding protein